MAADTNPIRYSDLIVPDNSIEQAIKQLTALNEAYDNMSADIRANATQLAQSLQKVSGATEEGRRVTRQAADDADRLAKAQRDLTIAQGDNARELAELKQATQEQNRINALIAKSNRSVEGSYNRLSAQYSLNKIRINQMSQEQRDAAEASEGLITKTRELYESMKQMQAETGKHQLNVGNYTEASNAIAAYSDRLVESLGLNNQFGQSLLALGRGGDEAKGVFTAMGDGAKALGNTLMGLMKNPVFLAIGGVAAAAGAAKWWYDYNAGLVEATRLTQQFTGLAGNDLKAVRNQVTVLADSFDADFREVMVAANAVSKQFGIDIQQSLNLVQQGLIGGANANGEFFDTLREYPAYFKEAGLSAEQFIAITTQAAQQGIFSDKGVDTIKEANLRLREMTTATAEALDGIGISSQEVQEALASGAMTTFDVIQQVSARLNELPDSAAVVGTAIADIFGGPGEDAGLAYIRTLKDINLNLDEVTARTGVLGELQEKQLQSELELQNALSTLFDATGGGFERMTTNAKVFINQGLTGLINGVISIYNYLADFYNESVLLRGLWNGIVTSFRNGFDTIANLLGFVVDLFKSAGQVIKGAFTLDFQEVKQGLANFGKSFADLGRETAKDFQENFQQGLDGMRKRIKPIEIPVNVSTDTTGGAASAGIGTANAVQVVEQNTGKIVQAYEESTQAIKRAEQEQLAAISEHSKNVLSANAQVLNDVAGLAQREVEQVAEQTKEYGDIYDALGLKLTDEQKEGINASLQYAKEALESLAQARLDAANAAVENADREVEAAEEALDRELEARNAGLANNAAAARKELEQARRTQQQALQEQERAQRQQQAIQSIQQATSLVTASAKLWGELGLGAIPAIAIMWASFAAAKIKAAQMTQASEAYGEGTVELLQGGSHQSGNDIDLGTKPDGTRRRAEGGEFFAVINKRNSRRFRKVIPSVIKSLNDGSFAHKYLNAYNTDGMTFNFAGGGTDIRELNDNVRALRRSTERRVVIDAKGRRIEYYKNTKRIVKS